MKKIEVCNGRTCRSFGSERLMEIISKKTGLKPSEQNDIMSLDYCECTGYCSEAPNIRINDEQYVHFANEYTLMEEIKKGGVKKEVQNLNFDDFLDDL